MKSTFIKIAFSFPSLIPYLFTPIELRETTEGTPQQLSTSKKCILLRNLVGSTTLDILKKESFC